MSVQNTFNKGAENYYYYCHHICALWQHSMQWHAFFKKMTKLVRNQKGAVRIFFAAEAYSHDQTCFTIL